MPIILTERGKLYTFTSTGKGDINASPTLDPDSPADLEFLRNTIAGMLGGEDKFVMEYIRDDGRLFLQTVKITDEMTQTVNALLERVIPQNIVVDYDPFPLDYTRLAFLESTGTQTLSFDWTTDIFYTVDIACMKHSDVVTDMGIQRIDYKTRYSAQSVGWGLYAVGHVGGAELTEIGKRVTVYHELNNSSHTSALGVNDKIWRSTFYPQEQPQRYYMFTAGWNKGHYRIFQAHIMDKQNKEMSFVPAISPDGAPCMYDKITKQSFFNSGSGSFIAGIETLAQLQNMANNLPNSSETITLSLPDTFQTDADAQAAIAAIEAKGWDVKIHEWRVTDSNATQTT